LLQRPCGISPRLQPASPWGSPSPPRDFAVRLTLFFIWGYDGPFLYRSLFHREKLSSGLSRDLPRNFDMPPPPGRVKTSRVVNLAFSYNNSKIPGWYTSSPGFDPCFFREGISPSMVFPFSKKPICCTEILNAGPPPFWPREPPPRPKNLRIGTFSFHPEDRFPLTLPGKGRETGCRDDILDRGCVDDLSSLRRPVSVKDSPVNFLRRIRTRLARFFAVTLPPERLSCFFFQVVEFPALQRGV